MKSIIIKDPVFEPSSPTLSSTRSTEYSRELSIIEESPHAPKKAEEKKKIKLKKCKKSEYSKIKKGKVTSKALESLGGEATTPEIVLELLERSIKLPFKGHKLEKLVKSVNMDISFGISDIAEQRDNPKKEQTLIIDLDKTLIYGSSNEDLAQKARLDQIHESSNGIQFLIRPYALDFLFELYPYYELISFTASMEEYASPILDKLEELIGVKVFAHRLYRQHCYPNYQGVGVGNKGEVLCKRPVLNRDRNQVIIVDDIPQMWFFALDNLVPIKPYKGKGKDNTLLYLKTYLYEITRMEGGTLRERNKNLLYQAIARVYQI